MSRREKLRQNTIDEIKQIARRQMGETGTAGLSLSAIAREMELSQPAIYRYYASRDDLITDLIAGAYNDLADALQQASAALPQPAYAARLDAVLWAYRAWALEHKVDFSLIYGNPIPGYQAPAEVTLPPAMRSFSVILDILAGAYAAGRLTPGPEVTQLPAGLHPILPPGVPVPPEVYMIGLIGWARVHGMIMLELFEHNTSQISDLDLFYRHEVHALMRSIGMDPAG